MSAPGSARAAVSKPEPRAEVEVKLTREEWEQHSWAQNTKKQLRKWRNLEIAAGTQFANRYESTPQACWLTEAAHSVNQQLVYLALRACGGGEFNRRFRPGQAQISGSTIDGVAYHWRVHISLGALAYLIGQMNGGKAMPISTLRRCLKRLSEKHSIIIHEVIRRGDNRVSNREASVLEIPLWGDVLAARANDAKIGTTHVSAEKPNGYQWTDGRSNSMNLLSPEKVREWKIEQIVKVGNKSAVTNSAPPQREVRSDPPPPAPLARPSEAAVSSVQPATKAAPKVVVAADVREKLNVEVSWKWDTREQLRTQPIRDWLGEAFGYVCDNRIGCEIVSNAIATAAQHDPPREFPIRGALQNFGHEGLIECCSWAIDKIRDPKTRVPRYKASPAGYLAHMMGDQAHVDGYLDNLERRRKREHKDANKAREECKTALAMHKRKPTEDTLDLMAKHRLLLTEADPLALEIEAILVAAGHWSARFREDG